MRTSITYRTKSFKKLKTEWERRVEGEARDEEWGEKKEWVNGVEIILELFQSNLFRMLVEYNLLIWKMVWFSCSAMQYGALLHSNRGRAWRKTNRRLMKEGIYHSKTLTMTGNNVNDLVRFRMLIFDYFSEKWDMFSRVVSIFIFWS